MLTNKEIEVLCYRRAAYRGSGALIGNQVI